jgi:hypothetical protein
LRGARSILATAGVALAGALALPAAATAATYCVNTTGACDQSFDDTQLQNALDAAAANPGHDQVLIGSGTYSEPTGFSYDVPATPVNTIDIVGAGSGQTTIEADSGDGVTALLVNTNRPTEEAGSSTISDLTVEAPSGSMTTANVGLGLHRATAVRVSVTGPGLALGAGLVLDGVFASGSVDVATGPNALGVAESSVDATVEDSTIVAGTGVLNASDVGATTYVRRSDITANQGIVSTGGTVIADNAVIELFGSDQVGVLSTSPGPLLPEIHADHLTIVGEGTADSTGVKVEGQASATVTNSIIRAVGHSLDRNGTFGEANLTAAYSDYDPAMNVDTGSGTLTEGPGNVNVDPLFVNGFHLQPTSPVIDAGDPAACGGTDRDGNPRVVDGEGAAGARTDMGAFEYQSGGETCPAAPPPVGGAPPGDGGADDADPPDTAITGGPKRKTRRKSASFAFASTEPGSSFRCAVDGQTLKVPCTSPHEVRVKRGKHTFEVRAVDAAGNPDPTPASQAWKVKRKRR